MKTRKRISVYSTFLALLALVSVDTLAGSVGSLTHVPYAASVPMLEGAGLVILSALLGVVSLRFLRQRGNQFLLVATATAAIATAGGGVKLISDAQAMHEISMSEAAGGVIELPSSGLNIVFNNTGRTQQISEISPNPGCSIENPPNGGGLDDGNGGLQGGNGGSYVGTCADNPGTVLEPNDNCEVFICCEVNGGCFD